MEKIFTNDRLTGLLRGRLFINRVSKELKKKEQNGEKCAIFYIDIDNFQIINDIYGYIFGDKVMKQIGDRFKQYIDSSKGIVSRIGSDEFLIFYPAVQSKEKIY